MVVVSKIPRGRNLVILIIVSAMIVVWAGCVRWYPKTRQLAKRESSS